MPAFPCQQALYIGTGVKAKKVMADLPLYFAVTGMSTYYSKLVMAGHRQPSIRPLMSQDQ